MIELLVGQVIAHAAYHGFPLDTDAVIRRAAYSVAGYPSILKPGTEGEPSMTDQVVSRVQAILNAKLDR